MSALFLKRAAKERTVVCGFILNCIPFEYPYPPPPPLPPPAAQGTPPSFTTQPKSTYVLNDAAVNTTLTIDCDVAGDPMPSFVWFRRDGNSYVEVDASFLLENGTLSIPIIMGVLSPHASTEGVSYYCTAMNAFGTIRSQTAEAFVASKSS